MTDNSFGSFAESIATIFANNSTAIVSTNFDDIDVDNGTLSVDTINNRLGINNVTPTVTLDVIGAIKSSSTITGTSLVGLLTTAAQTNVTSLGTQAANLNMGGFNVTNAGTLAGTLTTAAQNNITSLGWHKCNIRCSEYN